MRRGGAAALALAALLAPAGGAASAASLRCAGRVAHATRTPIMLVTGTGTSGDEAYALLRPAFAALGAGVCWVNFPHHTTAELQRSASELVRGLRAMHRRAGRRLAVFGFSQGALLPRVALTYWPSLRAMVGDVVAVAGTQHGTTLAGFTDCRRHRQPCIPAAWQQARGSAFLRALNAYPDESPGPTAWTTVRSASDEVVLPAAGAALRGASNVRIQDVCPGRRTSHLATALDSVTFALLADALAHRGPAEPGRLPAGTCARPYAKGLDERRARAVLDAAVRLSVTRTLREPKVRREPPLMSADTSRPGRIDLYYGDVAGTTATFFELVGERRVRVGEVTTDGVAPAKLADALTWSCVRRTRRLVAAAVHPDGTTATARYAVRTPGCRDRLALTAPRTAAPGARIAVGVVDRWSLGDVAPLLCVRSPAGRRTCRRVDFAGAARAERPVALTRDGAWSLDLRLGRLHWRRSVRVGLVAGGTQPAARPVVLVTGDSTVEGIDAFLGDRLRTSAHVVSDFWPGSAIGHDWDHWPAFAAREAGRHRPRVSVVSVGVMEGYPMRLPDGSTEACCTARWRAELRRRTAAVMAALVRGGRGRVLWLTLPRPSDPRRARISAVVNAAALEAAARAPDVVVVRVDRVLSPGWRFRRTLRYHGTRRVVRADDGIHLSLAGARIATDLVLRALSRLDLSVQAAR